MEKLLLIDAYAQIFRAYYALIKNPRINSKGFNTSAIMGFVNTLEEVLRKENPTHVGIAFDPSGPTFRHILYKEYKAQREETPEDIRKSVPIIKDIIRAYNIPIIEVQGYEADDVIGTLSHQAKERNITTYMMTPDKDYGQLVGGSVYMYRPKFGDKEFEVMGIPEVTAKYDIKTPDQVIDMLGLMGDSADNIPGCPGVGEKTASKLINEFGSVENLLEHTDQLKGALKTKVESNVEKIKMSKYLATIKTDVPVTLDMESLKREEINATELKKIFEELEFRALSQRILNNVNSPKKEEATQGDLFAEMTTEGTETEEKRNLTSLETINHKYHFVENEDEMVELRDFLLTTENLSLDTETTSTEPMEAKLVGLSFSVTENEAYYIGVPADETKAKEVVEIFKPVYENEKINKIGQNIKYDMIVLHNYGVEVKGEIFDTMVAHYILSPELRHNMDYMAEILLNYKTVKIEELIGEKGKGQKNMRDLDPRSISDYACEDADVTLKLKHVLEQKLEEGGLKELFTEVEMPLVPVLANMEENGARVDTEALKEISKEYTGKMNQLEKEIHELAGGEFNISSPKQVGEVLFDKMKLSDRAKKTKSGQYVTSEDVLEKLSHGNPIVEKILEYRGYKKLLSTYIDSLPTLINPRTGRIHSSFNQTVTATGRLSSSNPNLQNIPVRNENGKEIRKAFIPDDGEEFFSADYSQIELRIMAHLSQDANMIEAFREGDDIHAATAAKIYKKPLEEVTKEERRKAKTANFGIIYGITVFGLAERLEISRGDAKELIDGYFQNYPDVKAYMEKSIETARKKGFTETIFNRRCYLPDINSHNSVVRGYAERNAINAPIQGSAADIIKVAMAKIYKRFKAENLRAKMIIQVHDELNFTVPKDEKERVETIVIEEMEKAYKMSVPLIADCGWGKNWLEAH
jgi:DNA polymerase-1